jgi:urea transport system permease protein
MLSLGHGAFFGLGGYAMAMYLKLEASGGKLPDFMFWSGLKELPLFWEPFRHPWFALPMTFILPAALAGGLGYLVFRSRITGVYFALITQALALILSTLFVGQQPYTGGTNGITNYSTIFGFPVFSQGTQIMLYYVTVSVLGAAYLLCSWIASSRLGRLLVAVRDDESRVRFSGYNPAIIKTVVFALSAGLAGIGGALFAPQVGIISPMMMGYRAIYRDCHLGGSGRPGDITGPGAGGAAGQQCQERLERVLPGHLAIFSGGFVNWRSAPFPRRYHGGSSRRRLAAAPVDGVGPDARCFPGANCRGS